MNDDFFKDLDYNRLAPAPGCVLISEPFLEDSYFQRTVVLLVEQGAEGAIGFILNKPIEVQVTELVENFPAIDAGVQFGGPVAEDNLFYLHTYGKELEGAQQVVDGLWWGGDFEQLKAKIAAKEITESMIRFFVGYSGWASGQLEEELEQQSWIVAATNSDQVMEGNTEDFWNRKLRSMGNKYAALANFPADPSLN